MLMAFSFPKFGNCNLELSIILFFLFLFLLSFNIPYAEVHKAYILLSHLNVKFSVLFGKVTPFLSL